MREGRPSTTASIVAAARGAGGIDPLAERLVPHVFARWARLQSGRWTRLVPLIDHMRIRTIAIDDAVDAAAREGSRQLIILGAGLCARAWRLPALASSIVFEVDYPATQSYKRTRLRGLEPKAREVRFVSVDFEKDDLSRSLEAAGHDRSALTTWVWEGVTPYLTPPAVAGTLDVIRERSLRGSVLALTYYTPGPRGGRLLRWSEHAFSAIGEPIRGLTTVPEMHRLLDAKGFHVTADATNRELAQQRRGHGSYLDVGDLVMSERILVATRS